MLASPSHASQEEPGWRGAIAVLLAIICSIASVVGAWSAGQQGEDDPVQRYLPAADGVTSIARVELPHGSVLRRSSNFAISSAAELTNSDPEAAEAVIDSLNLAQSEAISLAPLLAARVIHNTFVDDDGKIFTTTRTISLMREDAIYLLQQATPAFGFTFSPGLPMLRTTATPGVVEQSTGTMTFLPARTTLPYTAELTLRQHAGITTELGMFDDCLFVESHLQVGNFDLGTAHRTYCAGIGEVQSIAFSSDGAILERTTSLQAASPGGITAAPAISLPASPVTRVSADALATTWTYTHPNRTASVFGAPLAAGGRVFATNYHGDLLSLDASNGSARWRFRAGGPIFSNPVHADGRIFFGAADRRVYAVHAATGAAIWIYPMRDAVIAAPAVSGTIVYAGDESGRLVALDAADGHVRAIFDAGGAIAQSPVAAGDVVYLASESGALFALDALTLETRWAFASDLPLASPPLIMDNAVIFSGYDDTIYAVSAHPNNSRGELIWKSNLRATTQGPLSASAGLLLATTSDRILALDVRTGTIRWTTQRGSFYSAAAIAGSCAVASTSGGVAAYALSDGRVVHFAPVAASSRLSPVGASADHFTVGQSSGDIVALERRKFPCR